MRIAFGQEGLSTLVEGQQGESKSKEVNTGETARTSNVCLCVSLCVCLCLCVHVTERQTEKETEGDRDRGEERGRRAEKGRERDLEPPALKPKAKL